MAAIRIVFIHSDRVYMERLCTIFRELSMLQLEVRAYTTAESYIAEFNINKTADSAPEMVIAEQGMFEKLIYKSGNLNSNTKNKLIILDESGTANKSGGCVRSEDSMYWLVDRYQTTQNLVRIITDIIYECLNCDENLQSTVQSTAGKKKTCISAFFSVAGGTGCSITASYTSTILAEMGNRVFFMSLDIFRSDFFTDGMDTQDLKYDMIMYQLKKDTTLNWKIIENNMLKCGIGKKNGPGHVICMPKPKYTRTAAEFNKSDISRLLWLSKTKGNFDFIILDIGTLADDRGYYLIDSSDMIFCVNTYDQVCIIKQDQLYLNECKGKLIKIINERYSELQFNNAESQEDEKYIVRIPYIKDILRNGQQQLAAALDPVIRHLGSLHAEVKHENFQ